MRFRPSPKTLKTVVVFLFPSTPPKLSTIRLRERNLQAQNYRLHLSSLTNNAVIRQFYSPLSTSVEPISPPQSEFSYGGGGGYRTLVLPVIRFVSTNCKYIYTRLLFKCQVNYSKSFTTSNCNIPLFLRCSSEISSLDCP